MNELLNGIPRFFSPNRDGINDFCKSSEMCEVCYPNTKVVVFDRHGRIITEFKFQDIGWNGKVNGRLALADDYWFVIRLLDGTDLVKNYFSLMQ